MYGDPQGLFGHRNRIFSETYRCYPVTMMPGTERDNVTFGGKIILPPSALAKLASLHIQYPMLFQLSNLGQQKSTHAGVLEFIAEEGKMYIPQWMMDTLLLQQGQICGIKSTSLPLGKYVKIQPQSVNFLDITDPKAVLEQSFRNFSTLTQGDIIKISYNKTLYEILVMETKPAGGISIIETDLEVDFAPPLGYVEPEYKPVRPVATSVEEHVIPEKLSFSAFAGSGNRLNGKAESTSYGASTIETKAASSEIPAVLDLPPGRLYFGYPVIPLKKDTDDKPKSFQGTGTSLRDSIKKK